MKLLFEIRSSKLPEGWFATAYSTDSFVNPDFQMHGNDDILTTGFCESEEAAIEEAKADVLAAWPEAVFGELYLVAQ